MSYSRYLISTVACGLNGFVLTGPWDMAATACGSACTGINASSSTFLELGSDITIELFEYAGIVANRGSQVIANDVVITNCGQAGLLARLDSTVTANDAVITGNVYGMFSNGGIISAGDATLTDNTSGIRAATIATGRIRNDRVV